MTPHEQKAEYNTCPDIHYFGATYVDATCIDGYLWDLDAYDEDSGGLYKGGEDPCPFCNKQSYVDNLLADDYTEQEVMDHMEYLEEKYLKTNQP
jgi:hypothetical protein